MNATALRVGVLAILLAASAGSGSAASGDVECSNAQDAFGWWSGQESRIPDGEGDLERFWSAMKPRFQTGFDDARACAFLDRALAAVDPKASPDAAARASIEASKAALALPEDVLARPAAFSAARTAGERVEALARTTPSASARIGLLELARTTYAEAGLPGSEARIDLWLSAESETLQGDEARAAGHVAEAKTLAGRLATPVGAVLYVAQVPGLLADLDADAVILASHLGKSKEAARDDAGVSSVETARTTLVRAQTGAVQKAVGGSVVLSLTAIALVLLVRIPTRAFDRDVTDVEIALKGVPR